MMNCICVDEFFDIVAYCYKEAKGKNHLDTGHFEYSSTLKV
jgi:hypothetical protein